MELVIAFVAGLVIGGVAAIVISRVRKVGWLRVDRSIPNENPYIFLELSNAVDVISKKRYVTLKVTNKNFISQE